MTWLRRLRAFGLFWAVLQFALPTAVSFADAISAASTDARNAVHVEDSSSKECRPVHAEECALCRFLSNSGAAPARAEAVVVVQGAPAAPADAPRLACTSAGHRLPSSRAPPIA